MSTLRCLQLRVGRCSNKSETPKCKSFSRQQGSSRRVPPSCRAPGHAFHSARTQGRQHVVLAKSVPSNETGGQQEVDDDDFIDDPRIPVLILTGFLGSGKTTLLNNVLSKDHGRRIAIIENEFGSIDIDSNLIRAKEVVDGVEIVESLNGCACCTVRGDLMDSLIKLLANRRDQFDHIIIETTGLADPRPIISIFNATELMDELVLDGVVTLVDARNVERHLDAPKEGEFVNEALQQIAYAERLVLNKTDLVTAEEAGRLEQRLRKINGMAQIVRTQHSDVPIDYVLGVGGYNHLRIAEDLDKTYAEEQQGHSHGHSHSHEEHSHSESSSSSSSSGTHAASHSHEEHHHHHSATASGGGSSHSHEKHSHTVNHGDEASGEQHDAYHSHSHSHSHDHGHDHDHDHTHNDSVTSVSFTIDQDMDIEKVNDWLWTLVQSIPEDLFRYKGFLAVHGEEERYIFQGVHEQINAIKGPKWAPGEKRRSQMVFIGRDLEDGMLEAAFNQCVHDDAVKQPVAA